MTVQCRAMRKWSSYEVSIRYCCDTRWSYRCRMCWSDTCCICSSDSCCICSSDICPLAQPAQHHPGTTAFAVEVGGRSGCRPAGRPGCRAKRRAALGPAAPGTAEWAESRPGGRPRPLRPSGALPGGFPVMHSSSDGAGCRSWSTLLDDSGPCCWISCASGIGRAGCLY
jgi:hypothetical protein